MPPPQLFLLLCQILALCLRSDALMFSPEPEDGLQRTDQTDQDVMQSDRQKADGDVQDRFASLEEDLAEYKDAKQSYFQKADGELQERFASLEEHLAEYFRQANGGEDYSAASLLKDAMTQLQKQKDDWEEMCRLRSADSDDWDPCQTMLERIQADVAEEEAKINQLGGMVV